MRLLLDTQAFLWFVAGDPRLSNVAAAALVTRDVLRLLSIVSVWELAIKTGIGKLRLTPPLPAIIARETGLGAVAMLPVELQHVLAVADLPHHHRDPFDRLLIAQAIAENLPTVSSDAAFDRYPVQRIW